MDNSVLLYSISIIFVIAALTFCARLFPYILFGRGNKVPGIVVYLGEVLPPAVMILLIVYCLRNISLFQYPYGFPELISVLLTTILYIFTKNNLIAMISGTLVYMVLIQVIF